MAYTVQCQVCNMYVSVDTTRAYSLRFPAGKGKPELEGVELGGRVPWSGIRLVCKPCLAFLRGLEPPEEEVKLRRLVAAYVDSLDRAADIVASVGPPTNDGGMALLAVADDLRAILGSQEPQGGPHAIPEARSVDNPAGVAPRASQEPEERDLPLSDCIPW